MFVRFGGDTWLTASMWARMEYADGAYYHTWYDWPGELELRRGRPRGCEGRLFEVAEALPGNPAESGLLVELGAELAHVCYRLHHVEDPGRWCGCDTCSEEWARGRRR